MGCLSEDDLLEYVERRLSGEEAAAAEGHLRRCDACRRALAELLREARAMARLSHPNVLAVYDVGELDGYARRF